MKLVLILVLMIVSVMAVVGTFLINSVSTFYIDSFYTQMQSVFTTDTIRSMQEAAAAPDAEGLKTIIDAHRSRLGIDDYRNYYILDGEGRFVDGSNPNLSVTRTRNIIAAMAGEAGTRSSVSDSVMDIAVPLDHDGNGTVDYIVYIADDKQEISDLSWRFFQIVMQAMMFGLLAAILLSFLLSKTITTPIERITEGARSIAEGNFDQDLGVQSSDEIGELTRSFNYMARRLKTTVGEVQGERDKLNTLFLHMTDGVAAFTTDGRLIHMNPATENLLGVRMQDSLTFDQAQRGSCPAAVSPSDRCGRMRPDRAPLRPDHRKACPLPRGKPSDRRHSVSERGRIFEKPCITEPPPRLKIRAAVLCGHKSGNTCHMTSITSQLTCRICHGRSIAILLELPVLF